MGDADVELGRGDSSQSSRGATLGSNGSTARGSLLVERIPHDYLDSTWKGRLHSLLNRFDVRIWLAVLTILLFFIIPASLPNIKGDEFVISGGLLGIFCSCYVIYKYLAMPQKRASPLPLLLWRSVCDFGIAMRFLADSDSR